MAMRPAPTKPVEGSRPAAPTRIYPPISLAKTAANLLSTLAIVAAVFGVVFLLVRVAP